MLFAGLLDGDRLEGPHEAGAAEGPSADAQAAEQLGLVTHADLAHLDAHAQLLGQVLYQLAEIDPAVGGVEKDAFFFAEEVTDGGQLHGQLEGADPLQAEVEGAALLVLQPVHLVGIVLGGLAQDGRGRVDLFGVAAELAGQVGDPGQLAPEFGLDQT